MRSLFILSVTCMLPSALPTLADQISGGRERSCSLYRPPVLARAKPVPLVLVLHGGFGAGEQAEGAHAKGRKKLNSAARTYAAIRPLA
jgi:poly(3-hydroxybutyrate) depolymerase